MPYNQISNLPPSVQGNLPKQAQEIYLEAYNSALEQYDKPNKRRGESSLEETASRSPGPP